MSQLTDFLSHVKKNNIARPNRFMVNFSLPAKIVEMLGLNSGGASTGGGGGGSDFWTGDKIPTPSVNSVSTGKNGIEKVLSLTCLMADIPGYSEQTASNSYGNLPRKTVYGKSQNDFVTTFLVSGNYMEKKLFDVWHNVIMDESKTSFEYYDNYIANLKVDCLNGQDLTSYSFELMEAYPTNVSTIRLDRTGQNQQMVIDVTWTFHKIEVYMDRDITKPPSANPTGGAGGTTGANRQSETPKLSSFSQAVKGAMDTIKGFKDQVQGALSVVNDVKQQIRDVKMQVTDGIKVINGVVKDVREIRNVPTTIKNEVAETINATKNQLGSLTNDFAAIAKPFPTR